MCLGGICKNYSVGQQIQNPDLSGFCIHRPTLPTGLNTALQSLKFIEKNQHTNNNKSNSSDALDPDKRNVVSNNTTYHYANRRDSGQRQRSADENRPGSSCLRGHCHRRQLSFVAHFSEKDNAKSC